jgi:hypothetical protein
MGNEMRQIELMAHVCLVLEQNLMKFLNTFRSSTGSITNLALSLFYGWCKSYEYMNINPLTPELYEQLRLKGNLY